MKTENYQPKYPVQTLSKSLDIIEYLKSNTSTEGVSISEISEQLNLGKSSVHRILDTLLSYNYVEKSITGMSYKLGWGIFDAGNTVPQQHSINSVVVLTHLKQLCDEFTETINLGVLDGNDVVIVHKVEPNIRLRANVNIGGREPLYSTSLGKIFLCDFTEKQIYAYFNSVPITPLTPSTIIEPIKMIKELSLIKSQGYAIDNEELVDGLRCVAMPIKDYKGTIVAAFSVSGPLSRMTDERIALIVSRLTNVCLDVSKYLGHV